VAAPVQIDRYVVERAGVIIFDDPFNDGSPPPNAPNFFNGNPGSYFTQGTFGPETNTNPGILTFNPATQGAVVPGVGSEVLITEARLNTLNSTLTNDVLIRTAGYFNLLSPAQGERYGVRLTDFRLGGGGNDIVELFVGSRPSDGALAIAFRQVNITGQTITTLDAIFLTAGDLANAQIVLELDWVPAANQQPGFVRAGYSFGNGGIFSPLTFFSSTGTLFSDETFTRGTFFAIAPIPLPSTLWLAALALGCLGLAARAGMKR
jgi:hypothetical protein